jgi:hypothetical protein
MNKNHASTKRTPYSPVRNDQTSRDQACVEPKGARAKRPWRCCLGFDAMLIHFEIGRRISGEGSSASGAWFEQLKREFVTGDARL